MKIYLVSSSYPYEGMEIAGAFSTHEKAQSFIDEQKKLCDEYQSDQEKTDYQTDLLSPKCLCDDMEILRYEIDSVDHYEMDFKNLTLNL